jgi:hypothetical protein
VKVGGHPMKSVSHGLWKEKWGGVPSFIKEHKSANRSQNLLSMEDSKNLIASHWQEQPPLKTNFYLCFTNEKLYHMFNPCFPQCRAFLLLLCWVSTFYLYAPSKRA